MTRLRWNCRALCRLLPLAAAAGVAWLPTAGLAQEQGGGVLLTFGIDQSLRRDDNPDLDIPASGAETTSRTRLSFGAITETRTQRLALTAAGTLIAGDGDTGLQTPAVELSYRLQGASTTMSLLAFLRESDVDTLDFILTNAGGPPVFTSISGTGTQRVTGARATVDFGGDAPFGGSLSLGLADTTYTGTTDPDLVDNRRADARLSLRFALSEVTTARAALSVSQLDEAGPAAREDTTTVSLGLDHALTNGSLTADLSASQTVGGTRRSLSFGRSLDLPAGSLAASLGIAWPIAGGSDVIGSIDWRQELPRGLLTVGLSRAVTGNARDEETTLSRLSIGLTQELAARLGANLGVTWQDSEDRTTGLSTTNTSVEASLRYALTEDWGMSFGANHRVRDEQATGRARSTAVFLSLSRNFEFRP